MISTRTSTSSSHLKEDSNHKTTATIFQKLSKSLWDNTPTFSNLQAKVLSFLLLPYLTMSQEVPKLGEIITYFANDLTTYKLKSLNLTPFNEVVDAINTGIFGLTTNVSYIPRDLDVIRAWEYGDKMLAELSRGMGETFNQTIEELLIKMLDLAKQKHIRHIQEIDRFAVIFFASLCGAILVGFGGYTACKKYWRHSSSVPDNNSYSSNEPHLAPEATSSEEPTGKAFMIKKQSDAAKKTIEERLAAIGILSEHYNREPLSNFICPITHMPMDNPVITDDGRTYERSALEEWASKNKNCPFDDTKKISIILPNVDRKREILEFVEQKEREYQQRNEKKPNSNYESQDVFLQKDLMIIIIRWLKEHLY